MERTLNQNNEHAGKGLKKALMGVALVGTLGATQACINNNKGNDEQTKKIEVIDPANSDDSLDGYIANLENRRSELKASIKSEQAFVNQETERQFKEGKSEDEPSPEFYFSDTYYANLEEANTIDYCLDFYNKLIDYTGKPVWIITTSLAIGDASDVGEVQHVYFTKEEYDVGQKTLLEETSKNFKEWEKMMNNPNTEDYSVGGGELEIKEEKHIDGLTNMDIRSILISQARSFNNSLFEREIFGELASRIDDSTYFITTDDFNKPAPTDGTVVQSYNIKEDIQ